MGIVVASALERRSIELTSLPVQPSDYNTGDNHSSPPQQELSAPPVDDIPDGGYGWVIVSACSLITAFFIGGTYSWGVMQAALANEKLASDSTLAFVGSVAVSWVAFGAIPCSRVIRWLGTRNGAVLGCLLLGLGDILNGFSSKSVGGLFFTNGIVLGLGRSLCFLACGTLCSQWFKRRRGLANGLVFAGGGVGGCVQSIAMQALINRVGISWTFRIMGFVTLLVTVPAAMLLKERHPRATATIDWSLFKDPKFVLLFLGSGIATFPLLVPPFFIPLYASSLPLSQNTGSVLLALFNISSAVGRVGFGSFGDVVGPLSSLSLSLIVSAVSMLAIWPESNTLAPFVVFVIINGLGNGGFFATMPSVVGHVYGSRVSVAFAMIVTSWSIGYIMGAPVAGWLLDLYGGSDAGRAAYRPAMYYAGSMSLGSATFIMGVRYLISKQLLAFA
ncbi:major facilitator superfamily domain-containing protein [Melanogaster broomeanus]|nr:major facilitator superfamily domain-containing protein [Melanogaster broomeanus]